MTPNLHPELGDVRPPPWSVLPPPYNARRFTEPQPRHLMVLKSVKSPDMWPCSECLKEEEVPQTQEESDGWIERGNEVPMKTRKWCC